MILKAIPGTLTYPQTIELSTETGNKFASVNRWGELKVFGEDMSLINLEVKKVLAISENFSLIFENLIRLQSEIELLKPKNPILERQ